MNDEKEQKELPLEEREFIDYCEANDLDCNEDNMDEETLEDFLKIKKPFIRMIKKGRLVVDGTLLRYKFSQFSPPGIAGLEVEIKRPWGKSMMAMDGNKDTQQIKKLQSIVSTMIGKEVSFISTLDIEDWKFLRGVATLFLAD